MSGRFPVRVALVFGTLDRAGAEKQGFYLARALRESGHDVRVFSLVEDGHFGSALRGLGVGPVWFGQAASPPLRLARLASLLARWRPHVVQSTHFFANLYAALAARTAGALSIGAVRNDAYHELEANPGWGKWLLGLPDVVVANSEAAAANIRQLDRGHGPVHVLKNVLDLDEFDRRAGSRGTSAADRFVVVAAGRLVPAKRFDRLLTALALARASVPGLEGWIVGDGPERARLETKAGELGLATPAVRFFGGRDDLPALLAQADAFALTSDHEGVPNVVLEAMASRLPVVATPAGGVRELVEDGVTGYVVACDDGRETADRLRGLAADAARRRAFGEAGRLRIVRDYAFEGLATRLAVLYREVGSHPHGRRLREALAA